LHQNAQEVRARPLAQLGKQDRPFANNGHNALDNRRVRRPRSRQTKANRKGDPSRNIAKCGPIPPRKKTINT